MKTVIQMVAVLVIGTETAAWIWPDSQSANKLAYSTQTGLETATVTVEPMPHDCEFLKAPIGKKNCHYEKQVFTVRISWDAHNPPRRIVSRDEGRTWTWAEPSDKADVFITWNKVSD